MGLFLALLPKDLSWMASVHVNIWIVVSEMSVNLFYPSEWQPC